MSDQLKMVPVSLLKKCRVLAAMQNDQPTRHLIELDTVLNAPVPPAGDVEVDYPEFHTQGMGCGLEDRGITDRYEAMRHGWDEAIERCATEVVDPLIERVTRLTAELDGLLSEVAELKQQVEWRGEMAASNEREYTKQLVISSTLQSELTKALELLGVSHSMITFYLEQLVDNDSEPEDILIADQTLAEIRIALDRNLATPIAPNAAESCGQDAEAAKCETCDGMGLDLNGGMTPDGGAAECLDCCGRRIAAKGEH